MGCKTNLGILLLSLSNGYLALFLCNETVVGIYSWVFNKTATRRVLPYHPVKTSLIYEQTEERGKDEFFSS